ncbi:hypothetical protein, partial [Bartonella sp. AP72JLCBS]|uniref:hypothetical protein n=1 Tax=Bartonella sp. AP72JLCBS TaxID=3243502 RepID=UPI0035D137B1
QIEKGDIYLSKQESKDNGNGVGGDKDRVIGGARVNPFVDLHCSLNAISLPHHTTSVHPNVTMCVLKSYVASMHSRLHNGLLVCHPNNHANEEHTTVMQQEI